MACAGLSQGGWMLGMGENRGKREKPRTLAGLLELVNWFTF